MSNRGNITQMASKMMGLRIPDKTEKGLLVRIGTLIDAIVATQRGVANAPGSLNRKANVNNLKKPQPLTGSTENIFNGASVTITPTDSSGNLSHYEAQIDSDPNFSDPTSKEIFTTSTNFKGLSSSTEYHIRIRPVTKNGQVGDWASLATVLTDDPSVAADFDGTLEFRGETAVSKSFTFDSSSQDIFNTTNGGYHTVTSTSTFSTGGTSQPAASETDIAYRNKRSSTVIETLVQGGFSSTAITAANGAQTVLSQAYIQRFKPLLFFTLMGPADGATFPVSYTFTVQISVQGAAFSDSAFDTTWVQF